MDMKVLTSAASLSSQRRAPAGGRGNSPPAARALSGSRSGALTFVADPPRAIDEGVTVVQCCQQNDKQSTFRRATR